jgi:tRNA A-37 threonylcarbamoyl transferase component Bud32
MPNPTAGSSLGPYTIEGVIGSGSMGDVFRAVDAGLGRRVAIKILAEKHKDSPELRARFVREGRAVAAISHPNVVQVFTTGTFDERPFIAMEFLDGRDLGSVVDKGGPMLPLAAAQTVRDAALGLAAAAKAGLIHRDVKPSNIVQLADGRVKVTDFGLAKPVDPGSEPALTALGVVVGTPDYIAPEQARGETIDDRVDIYALGGTLYFLLTGMPPFRTGNPAEDKYLKVVARHLRQPPPDARERNPACAPARAELAMAMMAKRPGERPGYDVLLARLDVLIVELGGAPPRPLSIPGNVQSPLASMVSGRAPTAPAAGGATQPPGSRPPRADATPRPAAYRRGDDDGAGTDGSMGISAALAAARSGPPRWVLAVTALSAVFLLASMAYYLTRERAPAGAGVATPVSLDAAPAPPRLPPPDAAPALPRPPAGMLLVVGDGGRPLFFVDQSPVTHAVFKKFLAKHKIPRGQDDKPVTGVSYNFARAYAQTSGKRLLRAGEWEPAMATMGVVRALGLFEWVDDGQAGVAVGVDRKLGKKDKPPAATTFRFARDL